MFGYWEENYCNEPELKPKENPDYEVAPEDHCRLFMLKLQLPNGKCIEESVDREPNSTADIFNALVAAVARKHDATVLDIREIV